MNELEMIAFQIISNVGEARSMYIEAIQLAKKKEFEKAEELIQQGEAAFLNGHRAHGELIQKEASGQGTNMTLIMTHAEDQLMSAEAFCILSKEFVEIYKRLG